MSVAHTQRAATGSARPSTAARHSHAHTHAHAHGHAHAADPDLPSPSMASTTRLTINTKEDAPAKRSHAHHAHAAAGATERGHARRLNGSRDPLGTRPVCFPRPTADVGYTSSDASDAPSSTAAGVAVGHASDPNVRIGALSRPFSHQHPRPTQAWNADRHAVMQSTVQREYSRKGAKSSTASQVRVAGVGGQLAAAEAERGVWIPRASDAPHPASPPTLTPLERLSANRHTDLLAAAHALQARAAAAQLAADRLFQENARAQFEVAPVLKADRRKTATTLTNPFFLGEPGASHLFQQPGGHEAHQARKERMALARGSRRTQSACSGLLQPDRDVGPGGLPSSRRARNWSADQPDQRMVAPAEKQRRHDAFEETRARVLPGSGVDGGGGGATRTPLSTSLLAAQQGLLAPSTGSFVPHFLRHVHLSLHPNLRRSVFANGNQFDDAAMRGGSKFARARFVPRSYEREEQAKAETGVGMGGKAERSTSTQETMAPALTPTSTAARIISGAQVEPCPA